MLEEFVRFVEGLFPGADRDAADRAVAAIKQHSAGQFAYFEQECLPTLAQADVLTDVPFLRVAPDGGRSAYDGPGLLISNTCDAAHDDWIQVAPGFPSGGFFEGGGLPEANVKRNEIYHLFFVPGVPGLGDVVFDLSQMFSFPREWATNRLATNEMQRAGSLTLLGYYFFISKLTVHLLRPESDEVIRTGLVA